MSELLNNRFYTFSNFLSLSRIILMAPLLYCYFSPFQFHKEAAVGVLVVAMATDALDGYFARLWNQISEWGKIVDPLADKICAGIVLLMLWNGGALPMWYIVTVLSRDIIIFWAGFYLKLSRSMVLSSNIPGKIAVTSMAVTAVFAILANPAFEWLKITAVWVSLIFLGYSFCSYAIRFYVIISKKAEVTL